MPGSPASIDIIERELHIEAPPQVVFAYLTEADRIVEWMGRAAVSHARPGGTVQIDINGFDILRGEFVEVTPYTRVVFTMGWLSLQADAVKPGSSTVEFTLTERDGGTLLRLVHSGLPALAVNDHAQGWDFFVPRLASVAAGRPVEQQESLATPAERMAAELNTLLVEAVSVIEQLPDAAWRNPVPNDGRPGSALADHIAGHLALAGFAESIANGGDAPPFTADELDAANAARASQVAEISRDEVIEAIRTQGPPAVSTVRGLTERQLAVTKPVPAAGGAALSVAELIQGPLIGHVAGHLGHLKAAATA